MLPRSMLAVAVLSMAVVAGCSDAASDDATAEVPSPTESTPSSPSPAAPAPADTPATTSTTTPATTTTTTTPPIAAEAVAGASGWTHYRFGDDADGRTVARIDVNPDGTTWALLAAGDGDGAVGFDAVRFERGDPGGWLDADGLQLSPDRVFALFGGPMHPLLAAGTDGTAWIADVRLSQVDDERPVGDLWVYDGVAWTQTESGTRPYAQIDVGGDGALWGTYTSWGPSRTLVRYEDGRWTEPPAPRDDSWDFHVDAAGTVWVRTPDGVEHLDGDTWEPHPYLLPAGDEDGWIAAPEGAVVAPDGTQWMVLGRGDARIEAELLTEVFDGERWEFWPADTSSPPWSDATAAALSGRARLAALGDDHLFVATDRDLIWFDVAGTARVIDLTADAGVGDITAIAADLDGTIWIGKGAVLSRFDPSSAEAPG